MSAIAEYCRSAATDHLTRTIDNLRELVVDRCPGHEKYNDAYKQNLAEAYQLCLKAMELL